MVTCRERQIAVAKAIADELRLASLNEGRFWRLKRCGKSTHEAFLKLGASQEVGATAAEEWIRLVEDPHWLRIDEVIPGAVAALNLLRQRGLAPVVISARRNEKAVVRQLQRLGLDRLLTDLVIVSPSDAVAQKARALVQYGAIGYVGDSETDSDAALASGIPFAAVRTGQRSEAFLRRHGVQVVCGSLQQAVRRVLSDTITEEFSEIQAE